MHLKMTNQPIMSAHKLPNRAERRQARQKRRRNLALLMAALALPILAGLVYMAIPKEAAGTGPSFVRNGQLSIVDAASGEVKKQIEIEVKQDEMGRAEGMMWRKSMEESQGMLFIMERAEPQSFWMRNTYIPLDIIFISQDLKILNIRANAQPQTLSPQASQGDAKYVLEVVGGWCEKHGVKAGDQIAYELD